MTVFKRKISLAIILVSLTIAVVLLHYGWRTFASLQQLRAAETAHFSESGDLARSFRELQRALGFGGYIHNVKEYLLHRDPNQLFILEANIEEIEEAYSFIREHFLATPQSTSALKTLDKFISSIHDQYEILNDPEKQKLDPEKLDLLLGVDDPVNLSAIVTLEGLETTYGNTAVREIKTNIDQLVNRLVLASALLPITLIIGCYLAWLLNETLNAKQELEKTRQALLEQDEWLEETGRIAKVGGWELDVETGKVDWTWETYRIHGLSPCQAPQLEEAINYYPPESRVILEPALKRALEAGEPFDLELQFINAAGENLIVRPICRPVIKDGKVVRLRGSLQDITERRQLETRLRQAEKMEAVGTMAGGIAHNFNNALAIIIGNIELAKFKIQPGTDETHCLDQALIAAQKSTELVRQIMTFSRQDLHDKVPIQIAQVVNETFELLKSTIPANIDLQCEISTAGLNATISADASRIREALVHLCNNAVQAVEGQGTVKISLITVALQPKDISVPFKCAAGTFACLDVQDTGCGMRKETVEKIFDPFFTTKDIGGGTGIGLSTVHGIVVHHGGLIKVQSTLGQGTKFSLFFPLVAEVKLG